MWRARRHNVRTHENQISHVGKNLPHCMRVNPGRQLGLCWPTQNVKRPGGEESFRPGKRNCAVQSGPDRFSPQEGVEQRGQNQPPTGSFSWRRLPHVRGCCRRFSQRSRRHLHFSRSPASWRGHRLTDRSHRPPHRCDQRSGGLGAGLGWHWRRRGCDRQRHRRQAPT